MKVTLKLTQEEYQILDNKNLSHLGIGFLFSNPVNCKKGIDVLDVDKFREFLNDEINTIETEQKASDYIDTDEIDKLCELQLILSKLEDVVQNDEPKTKEVWNGYGRGTRTISIVQNDEPKDEFDTDSNVKFLENIIEGLLGHLDGYNYKNSPHTDTIEYYKGEFDYYKDKLK